ncbi:alpha/beta-hydrolase [Aureobasidium pullulans]|uniref:Alpha/beta-hydrolase n=1 Tax=Aureobasidium pullulans TaxID=5580 RepID=A0A4S8Y1U1_AURPU|nr:alpha/beta-hydrolase [Aureobasidium pullulans]
MSYLGLSSQSPLAINTAAGFGVFQLTLGLTGILRPYVMLNIWEVDTSVIAAKEKNLIEALIQLYGLRNVALGLMIVAVRSFADSRTLGSVVMCDLIVAFGDGFLQKRLTGGGEWKHWSFLPAGAGLAKPSVSYTILLSYNMPSFSEHDLVYEDGGKTLHYLTAGPEDGELIVFMHGWPGIGKTWHNQLTDFSQRGFKVVAPDMPGYGGSTARKVASDYAQEQVIKAMLALLKHLGRNQAIWVAHDWGCGTLWTLARTHPEVFKAACGMTVPYGVLELGLDEALKYVNRDIYPEDQYPWGQWSYQAYYEQEFEKATAWFDKDPRGFLKAGFTKGNPKGVGKPGPLSRTVEDGGWMGGAEKPIPASMIPDEYVTIDKETLDELVAAMEKTGFWPGNAWYMNHKANRAFNLENQKNNAHLKFPVLFIEAGYDTVCDTVSSTLAEPQKELCEDLTFVSIAAGHFVPVEKPQEVNSAIAEWLESKVSGKKSLL